jgi:diamine N-acetyltransferase
MKQYFDGEQVTLRALEPEDLDFLYGIENDPSMWDVSSFLVPYSKYMLKQYIAANQYDVYADQQLRLIIQDKVSAKAIGTVDISDFSAQHSHGMVGIAVLKEYRNRGIGKEALSLLCDYAFHFLHIHQLYVYVAVDNVVSVSLFKSCGFVPSGTLKEWLHIDNSWHDVLVMQLLHHDE